MIKLKCIYYLRTETSGIIVQSLVRTLTSGQVIPNFFILFRLSISFSAHILIIFRGFCLENSLANLKSPFTYFSRLLNSAKVVLKTCKNDLSHELGVILPCWHITLEETTSHISWCNRRKENEKRIEYRQLPQAEQLCFLTHHLSLRRKHATRQTPYLRKNPYF